jgi:long-chain acyl-CoA synthetase
MLYNNQNPYTTALLVPNKEALKSHIKLHNLEWNSLEGKQKALRLLENEIN